MKFPTPFTVAQETFNGTGEDDLGNDTETWSDPSAVKVIGWYASSIETLTGSTSKVVADVDLLIPPDLNVTVRDRFTLPGTGCFEVAAIEDYNHGFHRWTPGSVVKLKRVTGA